MGKGQVVPPPPPGFVLDAASIPPPPPGFVLEGAEPEGYREPQGFLETMGAMATGESEGLEAQGRGGLTGLGLLAPMALPVAGGMLPASLLKVLLDPRVSGALAGGAELVRTGDLGRAAGVAVTGAGMSAGMRGVGKAYQGLARAKEAAEVAKKAKAATEAASKLRTSTTVPTSGGATATSTAPAEVLAFPSQPKVSLPLRTPPPAAAQAPQVASAIVEPVAKMDPKTLVRFAREIAAKNPKVGEKIWIRLDDAGNPVEHLTPGQASRVAEANKTWIRNLWK